MREKLQQVEAGFDTVGIAVPCDDFDRVGCSVTVEHYGQTTESYRYSRKLEGGGFVATGIGNAAWLEASLPKRVFEGENWKSLPLDDTVEVLHDLLEEAKRFIDVPAGHLFEESKLVRVDLVRDFHEVKRQNELLDGLAAIDQPGRAKVRRFADPSANRAETLRVGPRAWGCTLYDKHTESGGLSPEGQIRFEARLHRDQLGSVFAREHGGCMFTVADLAGVDSRRGRGGVAARVQRAWFERVGFDRAVEARGELAAAIAGAGLSHTEAAGLWAYLTLPGWGSTVSKNSRTKYRRMARSLGYAPAFDGATVRVDTAQGRAVRLDYDTGRLVAA